MSKKKKIDGEKLVSAVTWLRYWDGHFSVFCCMECS